MGWGIVRDWFWRRPGGTGWPGEPPPPPRLPPPGPGRRKSVEMGMRVRLRAPIASSHTVHIPAGATGIVVGGDARAHKVSIELDTPRTVITVPWSWIEDETPPSR